MKRLELLKDDLEEASHMEERGERALAITAVLQKALLSSKLHPILVGGAAVEVYTQGLYASGDIDYVLPTSDELKEVMKGLGFQREGRLFVHPQFQLIIEFPSSSLGMEESYEEINFRGISIRIITVEDLIIDRLIAFKWAKASMEGQNILLMLDRHPTIIKNLKMKAKKHDVWDALRDLIRLKNNIEKNKLDAKEATDLLRKIVRKY